jgi:hypothetical protein
VNTTALRPRSQPTRKAYVRGTEGASPRRSDAAGLVDKEEKRVVVLAECTLEKPEAKFSALKEPSVVRRHRGALRLLNPRPIRRSLGSPSCRFLATRRLLQSCTRGRTGANTDAFSVGRSWRHLGSHNVLLRG